MKRSKRQIRLGTVLICVLACMGVVSTMLMVTMHSTVRARREARLQLRLLQTEHLCEAGILRAIRELKKSPSYRGETWNPSLDSADYQAIVEIKLKPSNGKNSSIDAIVIATLSSSVASTDRIQRSHMFQIDLNPSEKETE